MALLSSESAGVLKVARSLGEIIALHAGPDAPEARAVLAQALSAGAQRAVRVWDPVIAELDYLGMAIVLAAAVRRLEGQLVLAGDEGQGAVGPAVAEQLGLPHLCGVLSAGLDGDGASLVVSHRVLRGTETLRGPRSAVLCVSCSVALPGEQLPVAAGEVPCEVVDLEGLGLSKGELQHRRRPPLVERTPVACRLRPRRFESAAALVKRLRQDGFWASR